VMSSAAPPVLLIVTWQYRSADVGLAAVERPRGSSSIAGRPGCVAVTVMIFCWAWGAGEYYRCCGWLASMTVARLDEGHRGAGTEHASVTNGR
jgi:hypothetical protein